MNLEGSSRIEIQPILLGWQRPDCDGNGYLVGSIINEIGLFVMKVLLLIVLSVGWVFA